MADSNTMGAIFKSRRGEKLPTLAFPSRPIAKAFLLCLVSGVASTSGSAFVLRSVRNIYFVTRIAGVQKMTQAPHNAQKNEKKRRKNYKNKLFSIDLQYRLWPLLWQILTSWRYRRGFKVEKFYHVLYYVPPFLPLVSFFFLPFINSIMFAGFPKLVLSFIFY